MWCTVGAISNAFSRLVVSCTERAGNWIYLRSQLYELRVEQKCFRVMYLVFFHEKMSLLILGFRRKVRVGFSAGIVHPSMDFRFSRGNRFSVLNNFLPRME
jgi:hypothetical protein